MTNKLITIENIYKNFGGKGKSNFETLKDVSFNIIKEEFLVLLGPSGCGKSTILRLLSELDQPSSGKITYEKDFSKEKMSFVFQQSAVFPWLTVGQNVELDLIGDKVPKEKRKILVKEELKEFGLEKFVKYRPRDLSGGLKQRVGLARAFVTGPKLIFLDEPFSELDIFTAEELRRELLRLWKKHDSTVVMVSHNIDEAIELADRIVVFSARPGQIKGIIKNELPRPRNPRSKEFFDMQDEIRALLKPENLE